MPPATNPLSGLAQSEEMKPCTIKKTEVTAIAEMVIGFGSLCSRRSVMTRGMERIAMYAMGIRMIRSATYPN
jgi:hypothetical protein